MNNQNGEQFFMVEQLKMVNNHSRLSSRGSTAAGSVHLYNNITNSNQKGGHFNISTAICSTSQHTNPTPEPNMHSYMIT